MTVKKINPIPIQNPKQYIFRRLCLTSSLSILASLSGIIPSITLASRSVHFDSQAHAQTPSFTAQAQTFSLETIWRYAKAVQEINPIREIHNQRVDEILRGNRPERVCYQNTIPWEVKQNCEIFGSKMIGILKKHEVYNSYTPISLQVKYDENLKKKIQKAGACQQRGTSLQDCF